MFRLVYYRGFAIMVEAKTKKAEPIPPGWNRFGLPDEAGIAEALFFPVEMQSELLPALL
jgi:hypothetical protein